MTVREVESKVWVIIHGPSGNFLTPDDTLSPIIGPAMCWYLQSQGEARRERIELATRSEYSVVECELRPKS